MDLIWLQHVYLIHVSHFQYTKKTVYSVSLNLKRFLPCQPYSYRNLIKVSIYYLTIELVIEKDNCEFHSNNSIETMLVSWLVSSHATSLRMYTISRNNYCRTHYIRLCRQQTIRYGSVDNLFVNINLVWIVVWIYKMEFTHPNICVRFQCVESIQE